MMTRSRGIRLPERRSGLAGRHHSVRSSSRDCEEAQEEVHHESSPTIKNVLELAGTIVGQAAFLTALLYYFGWVRTGAIFSYFGIDQGMLKYSSQDYLLRSAGIAFKPAVLLLLSAAILYGYRFALKAISRKGPRVGRALQAVTIIFAAALLAIGGGRVFGILSVGAPLFNAVALAAGAAVAEIAASVAPASSTSRPAVMVRQAMILGLVIVGSFWACAIYAQNIGTRLAIGWAGNLQARPSVVIYSADDLRLSGEGVVTTKLGESGLRFRYSGLRLLIYSNERWFLLPENWHRSEQTPAIVLRDSTTIRVEMSPGR
jgi:hypothetical protein